MPVALLIGRLRLRIAMRRGHAIKLFAAWLALMAALHVAAMMWLEGMTLVDAVWVTTVTATTVGYGDVSAKTAGGRIATIVLMFGGSIFVLAALTSLIFERASERRSRKDAGKWRWKLHDHLLIISTTGTETPRYLRDLISQIRMDEAHADQVVALMTNGLPDGLPDSLHKLGVVYFAGDGDTVEELDLSCVRTAKTVVILGESRSPKADAFVYDVSCRIREHGFRGRIVAEVVDDANRPRLRSGHGDSCVRPVRGYPEILARAIVSPGAEQIIEEIFTIGGAKCQGVTLRASTSWRNLCTAFVDGDLGVPLGYRDPSGAIVTSPRGSTQVDVEEIFIVTQDADATLQARVDAVARKTLLAAA